MSFGYEESLILENVNLQIKERDIVTVFGNNGEGKSTFVNLILGFYEARSGNIFAQGTSYSQLNIAGLRKEIGYVPQQQLLFDGTVLDNITYGLDDVATDDLNEALILSTAQVVVDSMSNGLDTQIVNRGKNLSAGQIQRICIARSLLGAPKLLILDEPTNHLDADSVRDLITNSKMKLNMSILIISHQEVFHEISDRVYHLSSRKLTENLEATSYNYTPERAN